MEALKILSNLEYFGSIVNLQNNMWKRSPAHIAAIVDSEEILDLLLSREANFNLQDKEEKTPLFLAAETGSHKALQFLCEKSKLSIDLPALNGLLPGMAAAENGDITSLQILKKSGADFTSH